MNFKSAKAKAHKEATRTKAAMMITSTYLEDTQRIDEEGFEVVPAEGINGSRVRVVYTAQPGTIAYSEYLAQCIAENVGPLSKADWKQSGSLSYPDLQVKWHGVEKAAEMSSKSKHGPRKRDTPVKVSTKEVSANEMPTRGKTRLVWEIADSLVVNEVSASRAAIIEACVNAGINPSTAATQYSAWVRAHREVK